MRLLIKDRGKGKTTQMIHTSEATGHPIVVKTEVEKRHIIEKAKEMEIIIPEPLTINDIHNKKIKSRRVKKVLIDDGYSIIEEALKKYIGCDVVAVTLTDPIKVRDNNENYKSYI